MLDPAIYVLTYQLEGYINDTILDTQVLSSSQTEINKTLCDFPYPVDSVWAEVSEGGDSCLVYWLPPPETDLEFTKCLIAKLIGFDPTNGDTPEDGIQVYIGASDMDGPKNDFSFNIMTGYVGYEVSVIYNDSISSSYTYSTNIVFSGPKSNVNINAQLNNSNNHSGIEVSMSALSHPFESLLGYTNSDGSIDFLNTYNGYYDILLSKSGYQDEMLDSVYIYTDNSLYFVLQQNTSPAPPINLFVDSLSSVSSWESPNTKLNFQQQVDNYIVYINGIEQAILPNNTFEYVFHNLTYGNTYEAKVRAKYGDSISGASTYNFISGFLQPINSLQNNYTPGDDTVPLQFLVPINQDSVVADGLMSFNIYRNNELLLNKEYENESIFDTIKFTDYSVYHGKFVYSVNSVYDLTPYGFPDETGESMLISCDTIEVVIGGVNESLKNAIVQLFPNPTSNQVTISSEKEIIKIEAFNHMGQKQTIVENVNSNYYILDVSQLEKGIYILNVEIDGMIVTRKLIVTSK